jgi:hypothetical protein
VAYGWNAHHMDIKTMFFNNKIKEKLYMQQLKEYEALGHKDLVFEVEPLLYRLTSK